MSGGWFLLETFEASSFEGNIDLCGEQLNKSCPGDYSTAKAEVGTEKDGDDSDFYEALYISMGIGFFVGFWALLGPILIWKPWRLAYLRLWHRASTTDYPEQPTFIVLRPEKRFKLENLHPSTEYFCKAFQNGLVKHTAAIQQ
ncbi:hypothetical protein LR48_Vigan07g123800 [Vigna angularis]|uniref:VIN3-like fibronectin type-III domain-containing protein n=1 Tax=Phaseolus angularis TaxID=3914 RepID=A0A0L9UYC2_PHAAN|nr:hypothetical protein LR48_Vigan07g123800 [Vigna angularis]